MRRNAHAPRVRVVRPFITRREPCRHANLAISGAGLMPVAASGPLASRALLFQRAGSTCCSAHFSDICSMQSDIFTALGLIQRRKHSADLPGSTSLGNTRVVARYRCTARREAAANAGVCATKAVGYVWTVRFCGPSAGPSPPERARTLMSSIPVVLVDDVSA